MVLALAIVVALSLVVGQGSGSADGTRRSYHDQVREAVMRGSSFVRGVRVVTHASGTAANELGVTYGPYLGIRCDSGERRGCEKVGIDVVFRRAATSVVAIAGVQKIHLRTPGKHSGVRRHDWVGTFTHAELLPNRPYELKTGPIYTAVELRVRFAGGARVHAYLPHVLISSGWG